MKVFQRKKNMNKISVLMTVYNDYLFLEEAINSILVQTFSDFEFLIVVEFNSSPKVIKIIEKYKSIDSRIKIFYNSKKLGISGSLNKGIRLSSCEYIARMDSDDVCIENRLERQLKFMENNKSITILGTNATFIDEHGKKIGKRDDYPISDELIKSNLIFYCVLRHPTIMLRKKNIIDNNLFYDESYFATEDYELWNRAVKKVKFANMNEVLLEYRWYNFNATHTRDKEGIFNYNKVIKRNLSQLQVFLSDYEIYLLSPHSNVLNFKNFTKLLPFYNSIYKTLISKNSFMGIYEKKSFCKVLNKRMYWKKHMLRLLIVLILRISHKDTVRNLSGYLEIHGFFNTFKYGVFKILEKTKMNIFKDMK